MLPHTNKAKLRGHYNSMKGILKMNEYMQKAIEKSRENLSGGAGGPFGAVIVRGGEIIAAAHNRVLETNDPTMHAEIAAIRMACAKLGTFDLSDCVLYTSCEPCPMCLSAMMWAKIRTFYYGCTREDAAGIGFDDKAMYDYLAGDQNAMDIHAERMNHEEAVRVFDDWAAKARQMY